MGFSYFKNKNYLDITRDERFFCAHLYFEMNKNIQPFLEFLERKRIIKNEETNAELWEVAYEVCFYRDFIYHIGYNNVKQIGSTKFKDLGKRTFDLCLFSEKRIIIIEAKAQQGFDTEQMESFKKDKELLAELLNEQFFGEINLIGLASSDYTPKDKTILNFDSLINWSDINSLYPNHLFVKANNLYKQKQVNNI
jgi:hypothetical protein